MAREEKLSKTQLETDLDVAQTFLVTNPSRFKYAFSVANSQILVDACYQAEKPVTVFQLGRIFNQVEHMLIPSSSYMAAYREFFAKTPEFDDSDANRNLLDAAFLEKGLNHRELSAEDLANILPNTQGLSVTAEALQDESDRQERKRILKECIARLVDADGKPKITLSRDGLSPQSAHRREVERLEALDLNALRAIKQKRQDTQALREMPVEDLRKKVRQEFDSSHPTFSQYLPLPTFYSPPYKPDVEIPWSAELLKRLPSLEQRRLMRLYGNEQLTAALNAVNRR